MVCAIFGMDSVLLTASQYEQTYFFEPAAVQVALFVVTHLYVWAVTLMPWVSCWEHVEHLRTFLPAVTQVGLTVVVQLPHE